MVKIACQAVDFIKNTGTNSSLLPGPPALLIAVNKKLRFTLEDLGDNPLEFLTTLVHADGNNRAFPLFGNSFPIDYLANNDTQDTTITTDSGKQIFVKYGFMVQNYGTLSGGLCLAKALQYFNNADMAFIEVDEKGRATVASYGRDSDGVEQFGGMPGIPFAPKPQKADFANPARTNFQLSYNPAIYVQKAKLITGFEDVLDLSGLIDLYLSDFENAAGSVGIDSIEVTNGGSGYTGTPTVTITGGGGTGASATAVITDGVITSITVDDPGSGYTSKPTISITGTGTGATAVAFVNVASISFDIKDECCNDSILPDTYDMFADYTIYSVEDEFGNAVATTSASIVDGKVVLVGDFNLGINYKISVILPSGLLIKDIAGYEVASASYTLS